MTNILNFAAAADPDALTKATPADYDRALRLLSALSDPKVTALAIKKLAEKIAELDVKIAEADEKIVQADRREAILAQRLETVDEDIAKLRSEAELRVEHERKAFDADIVGRLRDLEKRERQVEQEHQHNVKLHDDLEQRLALIKRAAV